MVISSLSKEKILIKYSVPILYKDNQTIGEINLSLRYKVDKYDKNKYSLISKSTKPFLEKIYFIYKIGQLYNSSINEYKVKGVETILRNNLIVEFEDKKISLDTYIDLYKITDPNALSAMRDRKLQIIGII